MLSGSGTATLEQTLTECSVIFSWTWGGTWSPAGRPSQVLRWRSTRGSTSRASNPAPSTSRHQAAHFTSAETASREHCSLSVPVRVLPRHVTCLLPGFFWLADESPPVIRELFADDQSQFRVMSRGLLLTQWSLFCKQTFVTGRRLFSCDLRIRSQSSWESEYTMKRDGPKKMDHPDVPGWSSSPNFSLVFFLCVRHTTSDNLKWLAAGHDSVDGARRRMFQYVIERLQMD